MPTGVYPRKKKVNGSRPRGQSKTDVTIGPMNPDWPILADMNKTVEAYDPDQGRTFQGLEESITTELRDQRTARIQLAGILDAYFPGQHWDDSIERTAERWLAFLKEYSEPGDPNDDLSPLPFTFTVFPTTVNQMVAIKDIEFSSICMHHLLPFHGMAVVGYLPNEYQVGASKIPRLVDWVAHRPQTQEVMTSQIASQLKHRLQAMGAAVVIKATHTCIGCRGVRKVGASMLTSEMRGAFMSNPTARDEFLRLAGF